MRRTILVRTIFIIGFFIFFFLSTVYASPSLASRSNAVVAVKNIPQLEPIQTSSQPLRPVAVARVDSSRNIVGAWHSLQSPLAGSGDECTGRNSTLVFDALEVNATTGELIGGECAGGAPNTRYALRANNQTITQAPVLYEDFIVAPGFEGGNITFAELGIRWTPSQARHLYIHVVTREEFSTQCSAVVPANGFLGGVLFDFGIVPAYTGYVWLDFGCASDNDWIPLPRDGRGAYEIDIIGEINGNNWYIADNASFLRWGTENSRPGSQSSQAWVDLDLSARIDPPSECLTLDALPSAASSCGITNVSTAVSFWGMRLDRCTSFRRGDTNCDGTITNFDIDPFVLALIGDRAGYLSTGASGSCYDSQNCWGDIDTSSTFTNFDIDPFIQLLIHPEQVGACCASTNLQTTCAVVPSSGCVGQNKTFLVNVQSCNPFPCAVPSAPRGACCYPDSINQNVAHCADDVTDDSCAWMLDGVSWYASQQCSAVSCNDDLFPSTPGVQRVKVINPAGSASIQEFSAFGNSILFAANESVHGRELWISNGTSNGTFLIKDINPGSEHSHPTRFTPLGTHAVFYAYTPATGFELWRTDGTSNGTSLVKDINPGIMSSNYYSSTYTTQRIDGISFNNVFYFYADDGVHSYELWRTDGTEAGTYLFREFSPGENWTSIAFLTNTSSALFFLTQNIQDGTQLWKTDGTQAGTSLVHSFPYPSTVCGRYNNGRFDSASLQQKIIFSMRTQLANASTWECNPWVSDGTDAGTFLLADVNPQLDFSPTTPRDYVALDSSVLFVATGPLQYSSVYTDEDMLWKTDGTPQGTVLVRDINSFTNLSFGNSPILSLTRLGNTVIFSATNGTYGTELWKSDGTTAGTTLVKDIAPGIGFYGNVLSSAPYQFVPLNGVMYFVASSPYVISNASLETELWRTNGTAAGTQEIDVWLGDINTGSRPENLGAAGGSIYFGLKSYERGTLWRYTQPA